MEIEIIKETNNKADEIIDFINNLIDELIEREAITDHNENNDGFGYYCEYLPIFEKKYKKGKTIGSRIFDYEIIKIQMNSECDGTHYIELPALLLTKEKESIINEMAKKLKEENENIELRKNKDKKKADMKIYNKIKERYNLK